MCAHKQTKNFLVVLVTAMLIFPAIVRRTASVRLQPRTAVSVTRRCVLIVGVLADSYTFDCARTLSRSSLFSCRRTIITELIIFSSPIYCREISQ